MKGIKNYPDGTSYATVDITEWQFTFRINSYIDLWQLGQKLEAFNSLGIAPEVTIPNLIDAQADDRFEKNQSFGLKLVCKFLNGFDAKYIIYRPHNPAIVKAMLDNCEIISDSEFVRIVLDRLSNDGQYADILMSADAGGFKPLMKIADDIGWEHKTVSASKSRKYENGESVLITKLPEENLTGRDILIIDDLCIYGGTFKALSKKLREANCGKLYLAVSHMTVQNLGKDPVTNYFDKVFTTDSKFDYYASLVNGNIGDQPSNLEVITSL